MHVVPEAVPRAARPVGRDAGLVFAAAVVVRAGVAEHSSVVVVAARRPYYERALVVRQVQRVAKDVPRDLAVVLVSDALQHDAGREARC